MIWSFAVSDFRGRFAGSLLGHVWNVLPPILMISLYALVFSRIMPMRTGGAAGTPQYVLYLCWGLFPWMSIVESLSKGSSSLVEHMVMIKKYPVPEEVFVAKVVLIAAFNLAIGIGLLSIFTILNGVPITTTWLLLVPTCLLLLILLYGVGIILGSLNVFFRDTGQLVSAMLPLILWTLPIVYVPEIAPAWLMKAFTFHPLMPFVTSFRDIALASTCPAAATWLTMLAWSSTSLILSSKVINALRSDIRDAL